MSKEANTRFSDTEWPIIEFYLKRTGTTIYELLRSAALERVTMAEVKATKEDITSDRTAEADLSKRDLEIFEEFKEAKRQRYDHAENMAWLISPRFQVRPAQARKLLEVFARMSAVEQ